MGFKDTRNQFLNVPGAELIAWGRSHISFNLFFDYLCKERRAHRSKDDAPASIIQTR